jgi:hypothetical protein
LVDGLAKQLILLDPTFWIDRATARHDLQVDATLDPEFRLVFRQSDSLLRVADPDGRRFLLLFELQYRYDETMPRRMNAYAAQAEQKYGLPVCPVLVNFQPPPADSPRLSVYESECFGVRVRREFREINLWETPAGDAFQANSPALLALLPFLQGGAEPPLFERALALLRDHRHGQDIETFMLYLIQRVSGDEALRRLGARLDMAMLQKTDLFQPLIDIGVRQTILRLLEKRFGSLPDDIEALLAERENEQLTALSTAVVEVSSVEEFRARLQAS